jgi:plasmid stabilization system protein ParE
MQTADIAAQAVAILALAAARAAVAQGGATRVLADLISRRLRSDGYAQAWDDFQANPRNDSLVRHLVRRAAEQDAYFRKALETAVRACAREAQAGARRDSVTGSRRLFSWRLRRDRDRPLTADCRGKICLPGGAGSLP